MHLTHSDIAPATRKKVASILAPLLADALDLYSQAKQAHWNVRGPQFIALHELFDKVASEVSEVADEVAERMLQLGVEAPGTVRVAARNSRLKEYPHVTGSGEAHCDALARAIAAFTANSRKAIDQTDSAGDAVTADMLTEITSGLDKQRWFVEAHLLKFAK